MKGLDLCHGFFLAYGEPLIKENFSFMSDRIAAGMVGEGSECLGFDDSVSRDHDWGPGFCIWLTDEDFDQFGTALQKAYEKLPRMYMGIVRKTARFSPQKLGVFKISEFYKHFTGLPHAPQTPSQWMNLCDAYLCACTSGEVFYDPSGKFSNIRQKLLEFYPEDVRKFKIAAKCMSCAQSGQYNFMRSVRRGESVAAAFAKNAFCLDIMDLAFLLKKRFAPFYKWKHRAVKNLGNLGKQIHDAVAILMACTNDLETQNMIETLCSAIINEMKVQNISKASGNFLLDHGFSAQDAIQDEILRTKDVWGGMLTGKVLIIGGSYFAGRALVEFLLNEGKNEIFTFNRGNIPLNLKGVNEFKGDRTSIESIRANLPSGDWDAVIDFCGYSPEDIDSVIKGIPGRIRHYIFISTASVYDHSGMLPLDEISETIKAPQPGLGYYSEYVLGKIRAEECLMVICREKSIPWTIMRPSILYGRFNYAPRETYFFDLMEKEAAIVIPEHNLTLFNFIFVEDLAAIIGRCMGNNRSYDQVFNTVSPEFVTYEKFVEILGFISGKPLKIVQKTVQTIMQERIPLPFPMDRHEVYSGDKLQKALGFKFTPLALGMKKTYEFYQFLREKNKEKREQQNGCL